MKTFFVVGVVRVEGRRSNLTGDTSSFFFAIVLVPVLASCLYGSSPILGYGIPLFLLSLVLFCGLKFSASELVLQFGANLEVEVLLFAIYILQFPESVVVSIEETDAANTLQV